MQTDWSPHQPPTTRRRFLRTSAAVSLPAVAPGVAGVSIRTDRNPRIVWSRRDSNPGTQHLFDIVSGPGDQFTCCGYDTSYGDDRTFILITDRWGRPRNHRRGSDDNEWGDRGYDLIAQGGGFALAGVDSDAPMLVGTRNPLAPPEWPRTYDGTPDGAVHAVATGDGYAVGWTRAGDSTGVAVVGTGEQGSERWSDRPGDGRSLAELVAPETTPASLVAFGPLTDDPSGGWATAWQPDGTRDRDLTLDTPGDGPGVAVTDGTAVVLAGTAGDGWWLQRRASDWTVEWTRTYAVDGRGRVVDDLVVTADGYGLLAHDDDGTVVLRTDGQGKERWRGRYAPYTDGDTPADRGHAMVPVDGDEFVIAGATAPGENGRDWWVARVGEPGEVTPTTPEPTPTPPPTTSPPPSDRTRTPATDTTETRTPASPADDPAGSPSASTPGFGILAAIAGLSGWLALRRRND